MIIDDRARHDLFEALERTLGPRSAEVLMAHLPPVGWADVATKHDVLVLKHDLVGLEERIGLRFALVDQRFDAVDQRFDGLEGRMDRFESRMGGLESRMDRFEGRMDDLQKQVGAFNRHLVATVGGAVVAMVPIVFAVSHFAG